MTKHPTVGSSIVISTTWAVGPGRTLISVTARARMPNFLKVWLFSRIPVDDASVYNQNR
jgi:hypothetical protein